MWLTLVFLALVAFLTVVALTFFTRGTPIREVRTLDGQDTLSSADDPRFTHMLATLTNTIMEEGNRVDILANGDEVYSHLLRDLESAEDLITWHVYLFKPGRMADRLADILVDRARAGVTVLFLYDYVGSTGTSDEYFDRLRDAGVQVRAFRKPRWNTLYKFQQRSHTRAVVIDGRVGYTGGFAIADEWSGDGRHPDQWRDTSVRVEGAIVHHLQAAFATTWAEAVGELILGERAFAPVLSPPGDTLAGLVFGAPSLGSTNSERFMLLSIGAARERLYIATAYFIPGRAFTRALLDAVDRGVDVRVLTPGLNTDRVSTYHAGLAYYEELLRGGVRIYHYRPTMMHAKTLVADAIWAAVGTVNFDNRSMVLNDEVVMVTRSPTCGQVLEQLFLEDLDFADEVHLAEMEERGALQRIKERFYLTFSPIL